MAQDLTTSTPAALPAIDVREPSTLLFLPPWLATQVATVSDIGAGRTILDPESRAIVGQVATIPISKMPTGSQREAITRRIEDLHAAARPGPASATVGIIAELVTEYAPSRLDEDTADIKIGAYRDAVDDLPAWAVREAVRRWRRGEVGGDTRDLDFAPKPARLRRIAQSIAATASGQAIRLQRVLDAEPEEALTDAEREVNAQRLGVLTSQLAASKSLREASRPSRATINADALADLDRRRARREAEQAARETAPTPAGEPA